MVNTKKDYYKILGVSRNATIKEIKDAYRKLVIKYHPDISRKKETGEMLKEVNEAYTVLSNPKLREEYDKNYKIEINNNGNGKDEEEFSIRKVIDSIKRTVKVAIMELQRIIDEVKLDRNIAKLSNEELLQRVAFSENEFVKIAALNIIKMRKRRTTIPYLLQILQSDSTPEKIKQKIKETLRELGYYNI
jgi:curved DNA-binding protein CbpA